METLAKGFSKRERKIIKNELLVKGKDLFERYGLKRTRIKDLTEAVGIAMGSFYLFYNSKEELFFDILEREEEKIHNILLKDIDNITSEDVLKSFFQKAFKIIEKSTFLKQLLVGDEYQALLRKLPEERIKKHIEEDEKSLIPLIKELQNKGIIINEKIEVITGLFRGIFILLLHKKEIGEDIFEEVLELLSQVISKGLKK